MNQALLATLLTGAGTIILAIVNHLLTRGRTKFDVATQIRDELRKDNLALREEIRAVEKELSDSKNKCYTLLEDNGKLEVQNADLRAEIIRLRQVLKDHSILGFM